MPIYEYYCPVHHTVYQFYAKTLAQGRTVPRCPADPAHVLVKLLSNFAVTSGGSREEPAAAGGGESADDPRMEAALGTMEREFANVDENDPRAMARMMRRMAELSGEKIDGEMEEVVRKLEEGADPDSLEEQLGGEAPCSMEDPDAGSPGAGKVNEARHRFRARRLPPRRDPKLYDYAT
ncbi:MAG TPA: FmdB family transcriptional regulator [Opitutaceae bacterium]|nr:FmdB family transcriptional regulator [Opitutaceae bacterium]